MEAAGLSRPSLLPALSLFFRFVDKPCALQPRVGHTFSAAFEKDLFSPRWNSRLPLPPPACASPVFNCRRRRVSTRCLAVGASAKNAQSLVEALETCAASAASRAAVAERAFGKAVSRVLCIIDAGQDDSQDLSSAPESLSAGRLEALLRALPLPAAALAARNSDVASSLVIAGCAGPSFLRLHAVTGLLRVFVLRFRSLHLEAANEKVLMREQSLRSSVASAWQRTLNADLHRLRRRKLACQRAGGLWPEAVALLLSASDGVCALAALGMRQSVKEAVPSLLRLVELESEARSSLTQEEALLLSLENRSEAAAAAVRTLHALGCSLLFSQPLLEAVEKSHGDALAADALSLFLFECARLGLRCKHWMEKHRGRAVASVEAMTDKALLLACAALYRFCLEHRAFYVKAAPRLSALLPWMDFFQLRLMLRVGKHLKGAGEESALARVSRAACLRLCELVPDCTPQQLCCLTSFLERRSDRSPAEYRTLTLAVKSRLEESLNSPQEAAAFSQMRPLHDLVDVVDCFASHGLQSPLLAEIERVVVSRFSVCLDAFSRAKGAFPAALLNSVLTRIASSPASEDSAPNFLEALAIPQRLKFGQALTRLEVYLPDVFAHFAKVLAKEKSVFRSTRDAFTCVFFLARAVYIHPVLFDRAFRYVESRQRMPGKGICKSEQHLEALFLSHLVWSFLVAHMQSRPGFAELSDRLFELVSLPQQQQTNSEKGTPSAGVLGLSSLERVAYSSHRQPEVLATQVAAVLRAEAALRGDFVSEKVESLAATPWPSRTTRFPSVRCLEEQLQGALDGQTGQFAALRWKAAEQGALLPNPSSTKESSFCDNTAKDRPWPLSEVCGLVEGIPVVLLDASEGLRSASGKREFFYTGEVFLTLRCLRALGWSQVVFLNVPECTQIREDGGTDALVAFLRTKLAAAKKEAETPADSTTNNGN